MPFARRDFLAAGAAGALSVFAPAVIGSARPRVVVIGGGAGGATAARYLAKDSGGALEVILVEPTRSYYTCFFSNLYIGGFQKLDELGHDYSRLATGGVNVVHDRAVSVDAAKKTVALGDGTSLTYDRLILSPGIDFVDGAVPGWDLTAQDRMPHAYKGGTQAAVLRKQVDSMREGGLFVMIAPPDPYRCPPGPYERISMVAHVLKAKNPTAKILVLDPKSKFSKQALFQEGWSNHYGNMVEWLPREMSGTIERVDPATMEIVLDTETIKADVVNVIPAQKAGAIAAQAGITNEAGWAPVDPRNMKSRSNEFIHVLGDAAQQGDMPKSAFSANSQAKVCANAVRGELTGSRIFPARYANTCWSLIATDDGVKVGATYEPTDEKIASVSSFISATGEDADLRKRTYVESLGWYAGITKDMFG